MEIVIYCNLISGHDIANSLHIAKTGVVLFAKFVMIPFSLFDFGNIINLLKLICKWKLISRMDLITTFHS